MLAGHQHTVGVLILNGGYIFEACDVTMLGCSPRTLLLEFVSLRPLLLLIKHAYICIFTGRVVASHKRFEAVLEVFPYIGGRYNG